MPHLRILCALALAAALAALEAPTGVGAFLVGSDAQEGDINPDRAPCGGALVAIGDGLAVTLAEALPDGPGPWPVAFPGGRTTAIVERRGITSTAVLLRLSSNVPGLVAATPCDGAALQVGDPAWTAGNSFGTIEFDAQVAVSSGTVSGRYAIDADAPPARGRHGRILSEYRGPVIETDAAVNDGNHGGALLDGDGRLAGLVSLGQVRERRLGTAVPWTLIAADLGLPIPAVQPRHATGHEAVARTAGNVVLVAMDRPKGPGNPDVVPRPPKTPDEAPRWERKRLRDWWGQYWHQQQVFFTDQPVSALALGGRDLVTAASNLHGGARTGRVLLGGRGIACAVIAIDRGLDVVLLRAESDLGLPAPVFIAQRPVVGDAVTLIGRHRSDAGETRTSGRISTARRRGGQWPFALLQTDCLANYGSLGGILVDPAGSVAGMLVMLSPDRDWLVNSGIAMAIDAPALSEAIARLARGESRDSPRTVGLGISTEDDEEPGVMVKGVQNGTGAAEAGMQAGDRIVAADGSAVGNHAALSRVLMRHAAGDRVEIKVRRAGKIVVLTVQLREF